MPIKINGTNTAANPSITGSDTDTGIVYGSDQIDFSTGGTSKVTLNGSDLGIGTSNPDRTIHCHNSSNTTNVRAKFSNGTTGEGASDGFEVGINASDPAQAVLVNYENSPMAFFTNATERVRVQAGGGISFNGDTAAANALDDYEEGSFSPTFGASNGSSTTTYTAQQGSYTKIGNRVFFNVYIKINSISTGSHSVTNIGNLPFTNAGNRVSIHSIRSSGFQGSGDDSRPFAGTVEASSTVIELQKATDGGTNDFGTGTAQANSRVFIAGQYPIS